MKANRALASAMTLALAACSGPTVVPPPAPRYTQTPRPLPQQPLPQQQPDRPPTSDWRDAPATAGDWSWSMEGARSTARFSGGLAFACDRSGGRVLLYRQGSPGDPGRDVSLTILTQTTSRQVAVGPASLFGAAAVVAQFGVNDPLLDAMAFSRGRFAVQAPGLATLTVPSWPEISRVIEDCR